MDRIYKSASKVLVLDRLLCEATGDPIAKAFRIMLSEWMKRLWTLQEGLLPGGNLHIVFKDDIPRISDFLEVIRPQCLWTDNDVLRMVESLMATESSPTTDSLSSLYLKTMSPLILHRHFNRDLVATDPVLQLVHSLQDRRTTKMQDEAYCFAILTGVSVLALPSQPELYHVIEKMKSIPQDLIFAPGPRTTVPGFRWMPRTFMSQAAGVYPGHNFHLHQKQTFRDHRGIRLTKTVAFARSGSSSNILYKLHDRGLEHALPLYFDDEDSLPTKLVTCFEFMVGSPSPQSSSPGGGAALIYETTQRSRSEFSDDPPAVGSAILVSDVRCAEDGEFHAHYERSVTIYDYKHDAGNGFEKYADSRIDVSVKNDIVIWVD